MKKLHYRNNIIYITRRLLALFIDILLAYMIIILGINYFTVLNTFLSLIIILLLIFIFFFLNELFFRKTIGMKLMGLSVTQKVNNKIRLLLLRKFINFLEYFIAPAYIIILLSTKSKISLSEKITKCFVVDSYEHIKQQKKISKSSLNNFLTVVLLCLLPYIFLCLLNDTLLIALYVYGKVIGYS